MAGSGSSGHTDPWCRQYARRPAGESMRLTSVAKEPSRGASTPTTIRPPLRRARVTSSGALKPVPATSRSPSRANSEQMASTPNQQPVRLWATLKHVLAAEPARVQSWRLGGLAGAVQAKRASLQVAIQDRENLGAHHGVHRRRIGLAQQPLPDRSCSQHQHRDPSQYPASHLPFLLLTLAAGQVAGSTVEQRPLATARLRSHHIVSVTAGTVPGDAVSSLAPHAAMGGTTIGLNQSPSYETLQIAPPARLDPLHAMQFRGVKAAQVSGADPGQRLELVDRGCPPATARGRSRWQAGGTADQNDDDSCLGTSFGPTVVGQDG